MTQMQGFPADALEADAVPAVAGDGAAARAQRAVGNVHAHPGVVADGAVVDAGDAAATDVDGLARAGRVEVQVGSDAGGENAEIALAADRAAVAERGVVVEVAAVEDQRSVQQGDGAAALLGGVRVHAQAQQVATADVGEADRSAAADGVAATQNQVAHRDAVASGIDVEDAITVAGDEVWARCRRISKAFDGEGVKDVQIAGAGVIEY